MKPHHAVESAQAAVDYVWEQTKDESLSRAALTAIARHHSAGASGSHGDFHAHQAARAAVADVLEGFEPAHIQWACSSGTLRPYLMRADREQELLTYLLLARTLRLADQRSQQL
jgi:hypothetical protein